MHIRIPTCFLTKWQQTLVLLSEIFSVPVAIITTGADNNFKILLSNNNREHPYNQREVPEEACRAYSEKVCDSKSVLDVPNALNDVQWRNTFDSKQNLINYLGFPLFFPNGSVAGTICVMDTMERHYIKNQIEIFRKFAETINIDLEIVSNHNKAKAELQEKLDYESALRKDNFFAKVMLRLNAKLHRVYSKNYVKRYKEQIDEVVYLAAQLPFEEKILDLPKLFRYLIPDNIKNNIIVRMEDLNVTTALIGSQSTEIIIRILILYILLEDVNASIFTNLINNKLHISFLLTLDDKNIKDFDENIKESIRILSEQYKGRVVFDQQDDFIYKTEVIMPIEIR